MTDWHTPPFESLPVIGDPRFRMVSGIMDEEEYRVEGWERSIRGGATYWRASRQGLQAYARLRRVRLAARKTSWQDREEADSEWARRVAESTP